METKKSKVAATSRFPDGEIECRAGLWRDAEVDRRVLPSLVPVDGSQNLNYLQNRELGHNGPYGHVNVMKTKDSAM